MCQRRAGRDRRGQRQEGGQCRPEGWRGGRSWPGRMGLGGSQARQSMKQLTGARQGGREKRKVSWGFTILGDATVTPQGAQRDERQSQRLVGQRSKSSGSLFSHLKEKPRPQSPPNQTGQSSKWGASFQGLLATYESNLLVSFRVTLSPTHAHIYPMPKRMSNQSEWTFLLLQAGADT